MARRWIAALGAVFVLASGLQAVACPFSTASSERPPQHTAQAQTSSAQTN